MSACCPVGGFGTAAFGTASFGTGTIGIVDARALSPITVRVVFNAPVQAIDPTDPTDALYALNWSFEPLDPDAPFRLAQLVEQVDALTFDVTTDAVLGDKARYQVIASDNIVPLGSDQCACFVSAQLPPVVPIQQVRERFADIANPWQPGDGGTPLDAPLGTYQVTSEGDYKLDGGTPNLKKRIIRRMTTIKGSFFHLPDYGDMPVLKGGTTPGQLLEMQAKYRSGILREPDVVQASVRVRRVGDVVFVEADVQNTQGVIERVTLPVQVEQ